MMLAKSLDMMREKINDTHFVRVFAYLGMYCVISSKGDPSIKGVFTPTADRKVKRAL